MTPAAAGSLEIEQDTVGKNNFLDTSVLQLEKRDREAKGRDADALDQLRQGVELAVQQLGHGFLTHPGNVALRDKLESGVLSAQDYYRQLLRMVYQLLFLFVAEDHGLLLDPNADRQARDRYTQDYSTARLRRLAGQPSTCHHGDLYGNLIRVMETLGGDEGSRELGLPGIGGLLWSADAIPDLVGNVVTNQEADNATPPAPRPRCHLTSAALLTTVRALAFTVDDNVRRVVDYGNLPAEELGIIYESLLELHPRVKLDTGIFELVSAAGHERKTTGSYYTPSSLIHCLLDSTLDPVLDEAVNGNRESAGENREDGVSITNSRSPTPRTSPEQRILALRVCDPACGSGHFLIAAAQRIGKRLAGVRTGDAEPAPDALRDAVRDVIRHCMFGVDINPMAVELCKFRLWLESQEPGKSFSLLDQHIQCGNSLLSATPALLEKGIPNEAFRPIVGDDKVVCREMRRRNRAERQAGKQPDRASQDDHRGAAEKRARNAAENNSSNLLEQRQRADAWCAAFVWRKNKEFPGGITDRTFRQCSAPLLQVSSRTRAEITRLAEQYQFFHWHLAFPEIFHVPSENETPQNEQTGWNGGFDVVLGNPPWEHIELKEKEWFSDRQPTIAEAPTAAARKRMISALAELNPALFKEFQDAKRQHDALGHLLRGGGMFPLCARGRINTYAVFAELCRMIVHPGGRVGCIIPSGIATDDTTKVFFQDLIATRTLVSLFDFENRERLFSGVDSRYRFCLLTLSGRARAAAKGAKFVFFAHEVDNLADHRRQFMLSSEDIALLNPNTRTCPVFRTRRDADLTKMIYRQLPVLIKEARAGRPEVNPWQISFRQGFFNMSSDSHLFRTRQELECDGWALEGNVFVRKEHTELEVGCRWARYLPLYEGKMVNNYDHRAADVRFCGNALQRKGQSSLIDPVEHACPNRSALPLFWVRESDCKELIGEDYQRPWLLGFSSITSSTNARSFVPCIVPYAGVGNNFPVIFSAAEPILLACLYSNLSCFAFDFVARQKIGGVNLNYFFVKQFPAFPPDAYDEESSWLVSTPGRSAPRTAWILPRVLELTYTAWDMKAFAEDCGYHGPPFRWDVGRRFLLRCELDAAFFHFYGLKRDDVDHVMETFPIVKRKDVAAHGEYRTKRVILEIHDAMRKAIDSGRHYQTPPWEIPY